MADLRDFALAAPDEESARKAARDVLALDPTFTLLTTEGEGADEREVWLTDSQRHALIPNQRVVDEPGEYDPETGEQTVAPVYRAGWFALLRVRGEIADDVQHALAAVGAPHGVTLVDPADLGIRFA